LGVNRAVFAVDRLLPDFPYKQTFSGPFGISGLAVATQ
jgi:hypothetical protein